MSGQDPWAEGGMYDTSTVTLADRTKCFARGHDASYGSLYGWCKRCKHTVWTYDRKSVLYHGEYHRFPPAHEEPPPHVRDAAFAALSRDEQEEKLSRYHDALRS